MRQKIRDIVSKVLVCFPHHIGGYEVLHILQTIDLRHVCKKVFSEGIGLGSPRELY